MDHNLNLNAAPEAILETSPTTATLDEAIAKAQGEIENASKDKVNPAFRSKYADLASVWDACRPALAKHGIAVTQWPLSSGDNRLHMVTRLACKGEWMQARFSIPVDKNNAHGFGSAITYAKRFALCAALGIVAEEDDDGNGAVDGHKPGVPGSAGGGTQFRPERRQFTPPTHQNGVRQASASGARMAADEPESVARAAGRMKGELAAKPAVNAVEQMQWVKDARKLIADATTKAELSDWWRQNEEQRESASTAVPVEFDKLIVLFDDRMTAVAQAGA